MKRTAFLSAASVALFLNLPLLGQTTATLKPIEYVERGLRVTFLQEGVPLPITEVERIIASTYRADLIDDFNKAKSFQLIGYSLIAAVIMASLETLIIYGADPVTITAIGVAVAPFIGAGWYFWNKALKQLFPSVIRRYNQLIEDSKASSYPTDLNVSEPGLFLSTR